MSTVIMDILTLNNASFSQRKVSYVFEYESYMAVEGSYIVG